MCDDTTDAENRAYLESVRLSRRQVAIGAGAAAAAFVTGCPAPPPATSGTAPAAEPTGTGAPTAPATSDEPAPPATTSRMVAIDTPDGSAEAFFVTPASGQHPGVLVWPDVVGLRDAYRTMATRLAGSGYAVLAVNPYYRSTKMPLFATFAEGRTEEAKARIAPMREALTPAAITKDGAAFAAWLDGQKEVDKGRKLASTGYCMGGPFTFRTAAAAPERVGAIASFHGGGLVTADPASPHALFPQMKAAALICIAKNDDEKEPDAKTALREAAERAQRPAEIDVYPAQHGWCTIDSPVYDEAQAERAWARMLDTFTRHL
jgi:carboxymethylenebutenolidase